ncbi:MAG: hypothetical protein ABI443_04730, partial [Chthoniobacterales bacterium]
WVIGTKMLGTSMPPFPGEVLHIYHEKIWDKMRELHSPEGFLCHAKVGLGSERPPAGPEVKDLYWLNTDAKGTPGFGKRFYCDGKEWKESNTWGSADVSVSHVRDIIFEDMKEKGEVAFKNNPDDRFIFPMDAEDGETPNDIRDKTQAHRNWYPEYLAKENLPFGRPYVLNGFKGLNHPTETWEPASASDNIYALAGYLLHEYDKWIDSLPKEQQVTSTGKSKKELVRCSLQSYNWHDVPPNFNLDQRTRSKVSPFPKNRGTGKWQMIASDEDIAKALKIMLPNEPLEEYLYYSFSYYSDGGPSGIPAGWDASAKAIAETYHRFYEVGFRSIVGEIDLNFGKNGLGYYLVSKMLWNADLTQKDLDAIRDRWMQRSFGSVWKEMKAYYDFMLIGHYTVNSPNSWAKAIHLLDAADKKLDAAKEPEAQRRIDDLKQYWYVHYLMDTGKFAKDAPEVKEFMWKGQMAYMVGMQGLLGRDYNRADAKTIAGPEISAGPAHYTHEETQKWWPKILELWKVVPVQLFSEATLANGKPAINIDLNDLVMVDEFQMEPLDGGFFYNSVYMHNGTFLTTAAQKDDLIGFKLTWPFIPDNGDYKQKKVYYGVDIWDTTKRTWTSWLDRTMTSQQSVEGKNGANIYQLVDVQLKAPQPGVYRFWVGNGGNLSYLYSPTFDLQTGRYTKRMPFTYFTDAQGLTQAGVYIYIPKGTKSIDLDVWDTSNSKFITFYTGLPSTGLKVSRRVDIAAMGVHTIPLQPGEDRTVAMIEQSNFFFPFLYSVPMFWAKSPAALLVPRAIAEADGLGIIGFSKNNSRPVSGSSKAKQ